MKNLMLNLWKDEEGASIVEYVLLLALIAVVAIVGIETLGKNANKQYQDVAGKLPAG